MARTLTQTSTHHELPAGTMIDGRYRIEERLGVGGFGAVYRATQLPLDRGVALKILHPELMGTNVGVQRFWQEARLVQGLDHPNTVKLYDFGQTEEGLLYIVFQLLKGQSLLDVLYRDGPMSADRTAHIAAQVLKSLMEAHGLSIVHRDIKPENIFLIDFPGEPDFVKVLDFGVAKTISNATLAGVSITLAGETLGTPHYMAPEQVRARKVGPGTDLYALGLVMSEMLTGEPVFADLEPLDAAYAQISNDPVPLTVEVLDTPLGGVIARALEKAPGARFASAEAMLEAIREATGDRVMGPQSARPYRADPTVRDSAPTLPASPPEDPADVSGAGFDVARPAADRSGPHPRNRDDTTPSRKRSPLFVALVIIIGAVVLGGGIVIGGIIVVRLLSNRVPPEPPPPPSTTPESPPPVPQPSPPLPPLLPPQPQPPQTQPVVPAPAPPPPAVSGPAPSPAVRPGTQRCDGPQKLASITWAQVQGALLRQGWSITEQEQADFGDTRNYRFNIEKNDTFGSLIFRHHSSGLQAEVMLRGNNAASYAMVCAETKSVTVYLQSRGESLPVEAGYRLIDSLLAE